MKKLLSSLTALLILFFIIVVGSEYFAYKKAENLHAQESLMLTVYNLERANLDLANIQYRGLNSQLRYKGDDLQQYYENDFATQLLGNINLLKTVNTQEEFSKLSQSIRNFNTAAGEWYTLETITDEQLQTNSVAFNDAYTSLAKQINDLSSENNRQTIKKQTLFGAVGVPLFLLTFIVALLYRRKTQRAKALIAEAESKQRAVYAQQSNESDTEVSRTNKAPQAQDSAYIDEITGINNDKGFMHAYNEHKNQTLSNYTAICLFAVDKLDSMETNLPTEFSESVLKKIGFMLALYQHERDIIGRIEHNRFVIMLSREDKSSAVKDCDLIRKSIEDTQFTTEGGQKINITLSGGFVQKDSTQAINEILNKANKVLAMSIQHGGNRIAQLRDKITALK